MPRSAAGMKASLMIPRRSSGATGAVATSMRRPSIHAPLPRSATASRSDKRIEDPRADRLAIAEQRDHHREGRAPGGEIGGAVDRVDDPHRAFAEMLDERGFGGARFLADDARVRQERRNARPIIASASRSAIVTGSLADFITMSPG